MYNNTPSGRQYSTGYSPLEAAVYSSAPVFTSMETVSYQGTPSTYTKQEDYITPQTAQYHFPVDDFITGKTGFMGDAELLQSITEEAFEKTMHQPFPNDILITLADADALKQIHKDWHDTIQGFALNRKGHGISEVFVRKGELARVLLTLGHEIGHVLSQPLDNVWDEEAKAFAFSLAWMDAIKKHNIAELQAVINPRPAQNGLHNVAFDFVVQQVQNHTPLQIFKKLITKEITTK